MDLAEHQETIEKLQATFAKSKWANLVPEAIEIEIQLAVENNIFICKLDAVFPGEASAENGLPTFEVVDWKTGRRPADELQLAIYRVAWAELRGVPVDAVAASFYYVATGAVERPGALPGRTELTEQWQAAMARATS